MNLRERTARAVMRAAVRLARRIDSRRDVEFGCTISYHHPEGWQHIAPGAAQTGIKLANRAIQYGGQCAGAAIPGLLETFDGDLSQNTWLARIADGLARPGQHPVLPNASRRPVRVPWWRRWFRRFAC